MTPLEFLLVEHENVARSLSETLRHDYAPTLSEAYYRECQKRLVNIRTTALQLQAADVEDIHGLLIELSTVATFVSLIERARLGEFSWPFAEELRRIAEILFTEALPLPKENPQTIPPIIHVMSEGEGYQIFYEKTLGLSAHKRFLVVAFPRPLKHSVLMHALFGHELGHTATDAAPTAQILNARAKSAINSKGPMQSIASFNKWLRSNPPECVKRELEDYKLAIGNDFEFSSIDMEKWEVELICDAFGLVLMGPAFLAAHNTYLRPLEPDLYKVKVEDPSHPPFAIRHKMLIKLMVALGWNLPISPPEAGIFHDVEKDFLDPLSEDKYDAWADLIDDDQISEMLKAIRATFEKDETLAYKPPSAEALKEMVEQIVKGCPPIISKVVNKDKVSLTQIRMGSTLYAGWAYWAGRKRFEPRTDYINLTFLETNKLCDQALLQQKAIDIFLAE